MKKPTKPKMGRPTIPKEKQLSKQITVRFTVNDVMRLEEAAHDKRVAEIVREMTLEGLKRRQKHRNQ